MPTTPSLRQPSTTSASTSRLRKRASVGHTLSSEEKTRGGVRTVGTTPDGKASLDMDVGKVNAPSLHLQQSRQSIGGRSFTFEYPGPENLQPVWLQRKSTLSSLKSGSPATTERPTSSSITYSNGSAAPIFPRDNSPSTPPRNKLVKRSSSQRALDGSSALHSALRRPATSHQRSATLQRHFIQGNEASYRSSYVPSMFDRPDSEPQELPKGITQVWKPFFRPHIVRRGRDTPSRKRDALGGANREDSIKSVIPDVTELPTLIMATSISTKHSDGDDQRSSNISAYSRPFTPLGWRKYDTSSSNELDQASPEPRSRNSFSISDMFPSPSPSTWKMPRTASLRKKKSFARTGGRRTTSAPQPLRARPILTNLPENHAFGVKATSPDDGDYHTSPLAHKSGPMRGYQVPPSSPLPPLNRLSAFEVNLPETVPSYPTSPMNEDLPAPYRDLSPMLPYMSGQSARPGSRNQSHYPSGTHSDHTSTLLGSENDNSRFNLGDEDMDDRSETVFDSTRTAATGNSLAGVKRPPIETIFDESPSPDLLPKPGSAVATESLPFVPPVDRRNHALPAKPMIDYSSKEEVEEIKHPQHAAEFTSPTQDIVLSTSAPLKLSSIHRPSDDDTMDENEALWSFDHDDGEATTDQAFMDRDITSSSDILALSTPTSDDRPRRRESPPAPSTDKSSKANIFEWSEHRDKETSPGGSPRPSTVHGRQGRDNGGSRAGGRRGPSALHLRSQSVPVPNENRIHNNPHAKLEAWMLGNKGPSEDWDGDFDFEESSPRGGRRESTSNEPMRPSLSSGMLVPKAILERQATVHSQFGQVKELTLLVEELKRLQQQASALDIMTGQSVELWKEAEGIINLATLNEDDDDFLPPRSPKSPSGFEFDVFDDDSPSNRRQRSGLSPPTEDRLSTIDDTSTQASSRPSQEISHSNTHTPRVHTPPITRPRKESSAKAKSVLETIHQQRSHHDPGLLGDAGMVHRKLPFDTTSLKDLVTRAGVVTRALKAIVRRAEGAPPTPELPDHSTKREPPDPPFSQIFSNPPPSPSPSKGPRITHTPKSSSPKSSRSPKSPKGSPYMGGGNIAGNDNDINGHMKMMTVA